MKLMLTMVAGVLFGLAFPHLLACAVDMDFTRLLDGVYWERFAYNAAARPLVGYVLPAFFGLVAGLAVYFFFVKSSPTTRPGFTVSPPNHRAT